MYKIATLGSGNPRNFTWNIISNNSVVMPTGGCTVDSRNVTVNLPDFPRKRRNPPLAYIAQANKSSHFIFRVPPLTVPDKCLLTQHLMQQKASGVGVSLMRNGKILATGENISPGTVNKKQSTSGFKRNLWTNRKQGFSRNRPVSHWCHFYL